MTVAPAYQGPHVPRCLWCQIAIPSQCRRGSARKFCCSTHKDAFWKALHRHARAQFEAGLIPIELLKADKESVHALLEVPAAIPLAVGKPS